MPENSIREKIKYTHIEIDNRDGSVEHYYHFLLGFLVPLTLLYPKLNAENNSTKYIRSCGVLDKHIRDIGFEQIEIINKKVHAQIRQDVSSKGGSEQFEFVDCFGYDDPGFYSQSDFREAKSILIKILTEDIENAVKAISLRKSSTMPNVILIGREVPDVFYSSGDCEVPTAGKARRSIPNFRDLFQAICSQYSTASWTTLEQKSLAYQIALFQQADVIIAQHGAALANLIWCNAGGMVVEILPDDLPECLREKEYFLNLAKCMNLRYRQVWQESQHSPVNAQLVLSAMQL